MHTHCTMGMGYGIAMGWSFKHCTHTCTTHDSNTMGIPIPVTNSIQGIWIVREMVRELELVLRFNLMRVEICELRPEVVTEDKGVLVHYQSRTKV